MTFPILLSDRARDMAMKKLEEARAEDASVIGLRVGVKGGGCSGYTYVYDVATKVRERDITLDFAGLMVVVDDRSLALLQGATLDWESKLMGYGFKWINPNASGGCGCGASFDIVE